MQKFRLRIILPLRSFQFQMRSRFHLHCGKGGCNSYINIINLDHFRLMKSNEVMEGMSNQKKHFRKLNYSDRWSLLIYEVFNNFTTLIPFYILFVMRSVIT